MQESPAWLEFFNSFYTNLPNYFSNNGFPQELDLSDRKNFIRCFHRKHLIPIISANFKVTINGNQVTASKKDVNSFKDSPTIGDIYKINIDCQDSEVVCYDCLVGEQLPGQTIEQIVWTKKSVISTGTYVKITGNNPVIKSQNFTELDQHAFKMAIASLENALLPNKGFGPSLINLCKIINNVTTRFSFKRNRTTENPKFKYSAKGNIYNYKTFIGYDHLIGSPNVSRILGKDILGYDKGILVAKEVDFPSSDAKVFQLEGFFVKDSLKNIYPVNGFTTGTLHGFSGNVLGKRVESVPKGLGRFDIGFSRHAIFSGSRLVVTSSAKYIPLIKNKIYSELPARSADSVQFKVESTTTNI